MRGRSGSGRESSNSFARRIGVAIWQGLERCGGGQDCADRCHGEQAGETLFILREYGGSAWLDEKGYLQGIPELAAEVAALQNRHQETVQKHDPCRRGISP